MDPRVRTFEANLPRPAQVTEWADTELVTLERLESLVATLEGDWQIEGPLFEAGALRADAVRKLDLMRTHGLSLELSPSEDDQDMPETPPATLKFTLSVREEDSREEVRYGTLVFDLVMVMALLATGGVGYAAWRSFDSIGAAAFTTMIAFLVLFVAALALGPAISRVLHPPPPPAPPSPDFLTLLARVERHLRTGSPFVDVHIP